MGDKSLPNKMGVSFNKPILQIQKLKKEEEEEHWISEEELYTEGSSDEEQNYTRGTKRNLRNTPYKNKNIINEISDSDVESIKVEDEESISDEVAELNDREIPWRPKQGSMKLPNHVTHSESSQHSTNS